MVSKSERFALNPDVGANRSFPFHFESGFLNETFWRPSGTEGPRSILNTTPFLQPRVGSGFPGSFLVCFNGVVNKIALGPFVPEGLQKVSFKIRIQIGRESSGLPQSPDLGQNVRIWQAQRLTKVLNKKIRRLQSFLYLSQKAYSKSSLHRSPKRH